MAYDEGLAARIRDVIGSREGFEEKRMFGGLCFLAHGHMACGITGSDLIVRVGPDSYEEALAEPHTRVFDITGRAMKGWVMVGPDGHEGDADLAEWLEAGWSFATSLPAK